MIHDPNPLYMLMRNMRQRPHGPRPYDGILGASEEKVVAYEGERTGTQAITEAEAWIKANYNDGEKGTLIEIRSIVEFELRDGNVLLTTHNSPYLVFETEHDEGYEAAESHESIATA